MLFGQVAVFMATCFFSKTKAIIMKVGNTHFSRAGHDLIKKMTLNQFIEAYQGIIKDISLREAYKQLGGGTAKKTTKKDKGTEEESTEDLQTDI